MAMPPGIPFIIGNEWAERFSFYGMRSILLAYLTLYLSQPGGELDVFGNKEAEAWVHLFVGSAYLFPILGGLLADAFWGKYKTILILSLVYCLGHGFLACMEWIGDTRSMLLIGLVLIAIGSGGIKPCVSAHVGDQFCPSIKNCYPKSLVGSIYQSTWGRFYPEYLPLFYLRRDGLQVPREKSFIHILFGWLVKKKKSELIFGHHYAFGLPGVLMAFATFLFWMGRSQFAHIPAEGVGYFRQLTKKINLLALGKLWVVFSFVVLFWALFDQIGTLWQVQSREMIRILPDWIPFLGGYELLPAQVSAVFNPLFILILVPLFTRYFYPVLGCITQLNALKKMGIGLWLMVLAFFTASMIQEFLDNGYLLHIGWQVLACFILTASEVMVSITCLEFAYTQAPKSMKSFVMALFLLTVSLGNYLTSGFKFLLLDDNGKSILTGAAEFWFWTILMAIGSTLYLLVPRYYKAH